MNEHDNIIDLIYNLNEFNLEQITNQYMTMPNRDPLIFGANIKDGLMELCDIGTLSYDGYNFKVIPALERLSYRKFALRCLHL